MGWGTHSEDRDGSWDHRKGPGRVEGTIEKVRDGSGEAWEGPSRDGRTSLRSRTGRGTLKDVRDGSGDPRGGVKRVGGTSWRSGTGQGTHGEVPGPVPYLTAGPTTSAGPLRGSPDSSRTSMRVPLPIPDIP